MGVNFADTGSTGRSANPFDNMTWLKYCFSKWIPCVGGLTLGLIPPGPSRTTSDAAAFSSALEADDSKQCLIKHRFAGFMQGA